MKILRQIARKTAIFPIRLYQWCLSPWLLPCCRFTPTCSRYAIEAIETHGAGKGFFFTACRLMRCHPFGASGHDPVPPVSEK